MHKFLIKKISAIQKYLVKPSRQNIKAVLTYHGICINVKRNCVPLKRFIEHLDYLSNQFEIIKLSELIENIQKNSDAGGNLIALTFDDAYQNFKEYAYPELRKRSIPAALFVPAGFVGLINEWDCDHPNHENCLKIMNWDELRELDLNLIEIGSHGFSHKKMAKLKDIELDMEIRRSKEILEYELRRKIEGFAFPYGELFNLEDRAIRILKDAGYKYALTTHYGRRIDGKDLYRLKRVSIWDHDEIEDIANKLSGYYDWLGPKEKIAYYMRKYLK
jgi:peptidoglycan/xylan/chitin deacetylase (PgdA/CDA1 family)